MRQGEGTPLEKGEVLAHVEEPMLELQPTIDVVPREQLLSPGNWGLRARTRKMKN